jgi:uncharacterized protein
LRPSPDDPDRRWLSPVDGGWLVSVWLQPGARTNDTQGIVDGCLKLRLAAPPIEGRANEALVKWVAARLGVPGRSVELVAGQTSRRKRLRVACPHSRDEVSRLLLGE